MDKFVRGTLVEYEMGKTLSFPGRHQTDKLYHSSEIARKLTQKTGNKYTCSPIDRRFATEDRRKYAPQHSSDKHALNGRDRLGEEVGKKSG